MNEDRHNGRLPASIARRLKIPVISAPMARVSGPDLIIAACKAGVIGSFPIMNPYLGSPPSTLDAWLTRINNELGEVENSAPFCPNIIMRRTEGLKEEVDVLVRHGTEMVITSVGSPKPIMPQLKDNGIAVFADVATMEHARKAIDVGVDGLVLLTAGAGGQTGWLNAFAYVRAVRQIFDGPIVLAGGITDGASLFAAEVLGCDLAYMGTKFIATHESMANDTYREGLISGSMDEIITTKAFNGLMGNYMRSTIIASGLDPDNLDESISEKRAKEKYGDGATGPKRWTDIRSAGHSISAVLKVESVAELVDQISREYENERNAWRKDLSVRQQIS